ncbi:MAG: DedA family protein [Rhodospirillales bacterium]|nr:DedA family protein [Rhodospirillales bacterium]
MFRSLYDWTLRLAAHRRALPALALVSFAESSFFPIPPDAMLIPMCLARRDQAFRFAFVCTIASVLGGILGYAIGYFAYETVGRPIVELYGLQAAMDSYRTMFAEWGLWIILIKGLTPIPYKVVTIASGVAAFDPLVFILASIVTRAGRFFIVAALIWKFGPPIQAFIEKRLTILSLGLLAVVIGGFVLVKVLL